MTTSFFLKILKCHVEHLNKIDRQSVDDIVEANKHLSIEGTHLVCQTEHPHHGDDQAITVRKTVANNLGLHWAVLLWC